MSHQDPHRGSPQPLFTSRDSEIEADPREAIGPDSSADPRPVPLWGLGREFDVPHEAFEGDPTAAVLHAFGQRYLLSDAERELVGVYKREIAALLRQACALRAEKQEGFHFLGGFPISRPSLRRWRERTDECLGQIEGDDWSPKGARLLRLLRRRPLTAWPRPTQLAEAARRVEDSEFARLCLGYSLLVETDVRRAEMIFRGLLRRSEVLRHRWRVLEGLAICHEARGRMRLALGAIESAADDPHCGASALVQGLACALTVGDRRRARRAAARLDMLADPFSPDFVSALRRLRNRMSGKKGGQWQAPEGTAGLFGDLLLDERSPSGRVCRAMMI